MELESKENTKLASSEQGIGAMRKKAEGATVQKFAEHMSKADGLVVFRTTIEGVMDRLQGDEELERKAHELMRAAVGKQLSHVTAALAAANEARNATRQGRE